MNTSNDKCTKLDINRYGYANIILTIPLKISAPFCFQVPSKISSTRVSFNSNHSRKIKKIYIYVEVQMTFTPELPRRFTIV